MVATEVSGIRVNQFPFKTESKKQNKDMILTALKSENKSEQQHFAGHKAA